MGEVKKYIMYSYSECTSSSYFVRCNDPHAVRRTSDAAAGDQAIWKNKTGVFTSVVFIQFFKNVETLRAVGSQHLYELVRYDGRGRVAVSIVE
jgi:hypothetical protein